jgi:DNA-binding MarR family transcriptional regulator/N-acetylglutamate synthase-like GNAT family acetyltransferase
MNKNIVENLRQVSRKLVRELGMLQLESKESPQYGHSLIEIDRQPNITISQLGRMLLLSVSSMSRIVKDLTKDGLVECRDGADKREKFLSITELGKKHIKKIDEFSNSKIRGAFAFLSEEDQKLIQNAIEKYGAALERSRLMQEQVKIKTISTSRPIRKQIIAMIEKIQINEFDIKITKEINAGILNVEQEYYYNNSYNFWYAIDGKAEVIGSIGLKKLSDDSAELKKLFVAKEYRSKLVAKKLLQTLVKAAAKHGFKNIYLGTVDLLKAAQKFYLNSGFKEISKDELPKGLVTCALDDRFFKGKVEELNSLFR